MVVPPPTPVELRLPRDRKAEARSLTHLLDHAEHNEHCQACVRAKMTRKPARRKNKHPSKLPVEFGELVNADHVISHSDESMGLTGERDALVVVDRATVYIDCFPLMSKTAPDAHGALLEFFGS